MSVKSVPQIHLRLGVVYYHLRGLDPVEHLVSVHSAPRPANTYWMNHSWFCATDRPPWAFCVDWQLNARLSRIDAWDRHCQSLHRRSGDVRTQSVRQYCSATPAWFTMKLSQLRYVIVMTVVFCAGSSVKSAPGSRVSAHGKGVRPGYAPTFWLS